MIASGRGGNQYVEVFAPGGLKKTLGSISFGGDGPNLDYVDGSLYFCGGTRHRNCYKGVYQSSRKGMQATKYISYIKITVLPYLLFHQFYIILQKQNYENFIMPNAAWETKLHYCIISNVFDLFLKNVFEHKVPFPRYSMDKTGQ